MSSKLSRMLILLRDRLLHHLASSFLPLPFTLYPILMQPRLESYRCFYPAVSYLPPACLASVRAPYFLSWYNMDRMTTNRCVKALRLSKLLWFSLNQRHMRLLKFIPISVVELIRRGFDPRRRSHIGTSGSVCHGLRRLSAGFVA